MRNNLVPNCESGSRQWPLTPILLSDIVLLYFLGIVKLTNDCFAKCILVFFHNAFGSVLEFHNISLLPDPISESKDQFRIMSSEMKLAVSAWVTLDQVLLNDHK